MQHRKTSKQVEIATSVRGKSTVFQNNLTFIAKEERLWQSSDATQINKNTPVIAREERSRQPPEATVIYKRNPSNRVRGMMWQTIWDYGIFRRLPRRFAPRNDGVLNLNKNQLFREQ